MTQSATADLTEGLRNAQRLPEAFSRLAARYPQRTVFAQAHILAGDAREWRSETYAQVAPKVWKLARYLQKIGIKPGDKVAILSATRPEWMIADLALLYAGATSVSIYQSVNAHETGYILFDAQVRCIFAENQEQIDKLAELAKQACPIPATEERAAQDVKIVIGSIITFEDVRSDLPSVSLKSILADSTLDASEPAVSGTNEIASLVYTSGTTGPPKGVIQTHKNHLTNVGQVAKTNLFAPDGDIFLFLPLAHSFARLVGYIGFLTPTVVKFPAIADAKSSAMNAPSMMRDLHEGSAQVVPIVPRMMEKMMHGILEKMARPGAAAKLLAAAVRAGQEAHRTRREGKRLSVRGKLSLRLTAPLRAKIKHRLFGKNFKHVVSGGAKLPPSVNEFFAALGIDIYEGYGLTETCVATNVNRFGDNTIGSVGPPLDDIELRIASDGEILFRGPNVAQGYLNRPTATKAAWDDEGWFHTGDLGKVDMQGRLYITGRKKELIVTSGGKKISPLMIEDKLTVSPLISTAIMLGDGRQYCVALIVLDIPMLKQWAQQHGIALTAPYSKQPAVVERLQKEVDAVNATLSRYETIKKFRILDIELTIENGYLTPTFKVKKALLEKNFRALIDEMYAGEPPAA